MQHMCQCMHQAHDIQYTQHMQHMCMCGVDRDSKKRAEKKLRTRSTSKAGIQARGRSSEKVTLAPPHPAPKPLTQSMETNLTALPSGKIARLAATKPQTPNTRSCGVGAGSAHHARCQSGHHQHRLERLQHHRF